MNSNLSSIRYNFVRDFSEFKSFLIVRTLLTPFIGQSQDDMNLDSTDTQWLYDLLQEVQLEQFYTKIRDELQVTRLAHFDYVLSFDLENIGMGKPAARRLLDAVKKRRAAVWKKTLLNRVIYFAYLFIFLVLAYCKTDIGDVYKRSETF